MTAARDPLEREAAHGGGAPTIAIVGAGFAGIGMGIRLKQAGISTFTIFEKADRIGGTWRDNTYPGAACDVPSHLYSFSFEPSATWTRRYATQPEIERYLFDCSTRHRIDRHVSLRTEVVAAAWDDDAASWQLFTSDGEEHSADVVIFGVGQLNRPWIPSLEGAESFAGTTFHSARWRRDHDMRGRRVATIGNGASAVQLVPQIAPLTEHLTVFQRSPTWIVPKLDDFYPPRSRQVFATAPAARRAYRWWLYLQREWRFRAVREGGRPARKRAAVARSHLEAQVADPELREKLRPDYPLGCKRVLLSNDYYPTLCRDDVELVTEPIARVEPYGIVTSDGRLHPVDTIVYATGFEATSFLAPIEVTGRDGMRLHDVWHEGASAFLGMAVPAFPNMFLLYGPNTNLAGNSIIFMLECQFHFVLAQLRRLARARLRALELHPEALAAYDRDLQQRLAQTVWKGSCESWYKTASGRVTNNWPHFTSLYWMRTRVPHRRAFAARDAEGRSRELRETAA